MEHLPVYISIVFIGTALLTALLLYKAAGFGKWLIILTALWLFAQAAIGISGFYKLTSGTPPRFALLFVPPVAVILLLFITKRGRLFLDSLNVKTLTLLHIVRIPVELTLLWLYLHHAVPQVMTFEGRNFDVLCGLTAPLICYFGYVKDMLGKKALLAWNIVCLLLLFNIVITAILSAPFSFQKFGFDQPNIALLYFPFVWLPGFIVPVALLAQLVSIKKCLEVDSR